MASNKKTTTLVGQFIIHRMQNLGIKSLLQLVEISGLSQSTIYSTIRVEKAMQEKTAKKLAIVLRCEPYDLLELTKPKQEIHRDVPDEFPEMNRQLCWFCVHAVPDGEHGCSWSEHLKPVPGWVAEPDVKGGNPTYCIRECPMFSPDPPEDDEGK